MKTKIIIMEIKSIILAYLVLEAYSLYSLNLDLT